MVLDIKETGGCAAGKIRALGQSRVILVVWGATFSASVTETKSDKNATRSFQADSSEQSALSEVQ
ncbi:hypothetical protein WAI453_013088 [Rhynchosporium graminicola]